MVSMRSLVALPLQEARVSRAGGNPVLAVDATSQGKYGTSTFTKTLNVDNDLEPTDLANWTVFRYKDPQTRLASITIMPSENDALWPVALSAVLGQRVTVKRRPRSGATLSLDYKIEKIEHAVNGEARTWSVTFTLSPCVVAAKQPLILDNATYGLLDTAVLGY